MLRFSNERLASFTCSFGATKVSEYRLVGTKGEFAVDPAYEYAKPLERSGKVLARYHVVGAHGGAWIFDVESNEELERLLALMPVYNFARFTVHPLADMGDSGADVLRDSGNG